MPKSPKTKNPLSFALTGVLYSLPFLALNMSLNGQNRQFLNILSPGGRTTLFEYLVLLVVLFLLPIGAYISLTPMLNVKGHKKFFVLNFAVSAIMLLAFAVLLSGLGTEIYKCSVIGFPGCQ